MQFKIKWRKIRFKKILSVEIKPASLDDHLRGIRPSGHTQSSESRQVRLLCPWARH